MFCDIDILNISIVVKIKKWLNIFNTQFRSDKKKMFFKKEDNNKNKC